MATKQPKTAKEAMDMVEVLVSNDLEDTVESFGHDMTGYIRGYIDGLKRAIVLIGRVGVTE